MPLLLNDLRPRYPRPRPLFLYEEWAALAARLDTVSACLARPTELRRRYVHCQARYDALLRDADAPPLPGPALPPDSSSCWICGAPLPSGTSFARFAPGLPDAPGNRLPACPSCRADLRDEDALSFLFRQGRTPSLRLARAYLSLLYRYAHDHGLFGRFYLLDLLRFPHPLDLADLDRNFAFLALFIRSAGRRPALAEAESLPDAVPPAEITVSASTAV